MFLIRLYIPFLAGVERVGEHLYGPGNHNARVVTRLQTSHQQGVLSDSVGVVLQKNELFFDVQIKPDWTICLILHRDEDPNTVGFVDFWAAGSGSVNFSPDPDPTCNHETKYEPESTNSNYDVWLTKYFHSGKFFSVSDPDPFHFGLRDPDPVHETDSGSKQSAKITRIACTNIFLNSKYLTFV